MDLCAKEAIKCILLLRCLGLSISGLYSLKVSRPHRVEMMMVTTVTLFLKASL